tara:strand:+ start:2330 stop:3403 length:1074 start_codon:yes stop_codon:yes gene_type:complete
MTQKTISINPALFSFGKKTKKEKKKKEAKPLSIITPNSLKNKFIEKVKQHQRKKEKKETKKNKETEFGSDFQESLRYLSNLIDEKNTKPDFNVSSNLNKLESFQNDNYLRENVNVELPSDLKKPETIYNKDSLKSLIEPNPKPYGCLKNGSKPTYRQWLHTRKRPFKEKHQQINIDLPKNEILNNREEKLNRVKSMFLNKDENEEKKHENQENKHENNNITIIKPNYDNITNNNINSDNLISENRINNINDNNSKQKYAIKTNITRKYTCGKNNKTRRIGVMIKSGETRAKIIREKRNLTRRSISDVKNYLFKNGFLKVGSSAPKKILMDMYEACILSGKITNKNDKIKIHNYLNDK